MKSATELLGITTKTPIPSCVHVCSGNGYGSVWTTTRRFNVTLINTGQGVVMRDDAQNGTTFTVKESGMYYLMFQDFGVNANTLCIAKNLDASNVSATPSFVPNQNRIASGLIPAATRAGNTSAVVPLYEGDVLRAIAEVGNTDGQQLYTLFCITKVAPFA